MPVSTHINRFQARMSFQNFMSEDNVAAVCVSLYWHGK